MSAHNFNTTYQVPTGKPIFWHEGLFLQPQHFQWQDLYYQSLIEPINRYLQPALWGTGRITVNEEALSNQVFQIINGEFRFRDMTHAKVPGNAVLESRNFEDAWKDRGKPFTVYVGIRKLSFNGKNVSDPLSYSSVSLLPTRFAADGESESLSDFYEGGESLPVERLRFVLKLLWENEKGSVGDYEILPIAQLENKKGEITLSTSFIAPVLALFSSDALSNMLRGIDALITSTANRLEAGKKERGVHTAEFGTKDMVFLLTLRTLNRFAPLLRHMLGNGAAVHPWTIYGLLCQLVGELSTFSAKVNLIHVRPDSSYYLFDYDHGNLTQCFLRIKAILNRLMIDIAADPEYIAPFKYDGNTFALDIPTKLLQGSKRYYLVVTADASPEIIVAQLQGQAKMSAARHLPILVAQSLPGIPISHLPHPPPELPRRNMGIYFSINHKNALWQKVIEEKNLSLAWELHPENTKVELMVAGREG